VVVRVDSAIFRGNHRPSQKSQKSSRFGQFQISVNRFVIDFQISTFLATLRAEENSLPSPRFSRFSLLERGGHPEQFSLTLGLRFRTRYRLDNAQDRFGIGAIGFSLFPVGQWQLQPYGFFVRFSLDSLKNSAPLLLLQLPPNLVELVLDLLQTGPARLHERHAFPDLDQSFLDVRFFLGVEPVVDFLQSLERFAQVLLVFGWHMIGG
jgi:hypothetical protein